MSPAFGDIPVHVPRSVREQWPRLSVELIGPRHPLVCQSCTGSFSDETDPRITRWRECDEWDQHGARSPVVVLCATCADRLIEPHPRLYLAIERFEPVPGSMGLCARCTRRDGTRCTHPDLRVNGGPGLQVTFPRPVVAMICGRGSGRRYGRTTRLYSGPPTSCAGREAVPMPDPESHP